MNPEQTLSGIRVVLSRPAHPGNIGAAARAMKTMGLSRLYLVQPRRFPDPEARAMSANAIELLDRAIVCASLDEALAGCAWVVALSARTRQISLPALDARAAACEIAARARFQEAALVFGGETAGLSNDEVMKCGALAYIPASPAYTSLNLGAAVQVMAYEVRTAVCGNAPPAAQHVELARHEEVENLYEHVEQSLVRSGFLQRDGHGRTMERVRRLFSRTRLEADEVKMLRGMLKAWEELAGTRRK